jgi:hypothetical protein
MPSSWHAFYGTDFFGIHQHSLNEEVYRDDLPGFLVVVPGVMTRENYQAFVAWWSSWREEQQSLEDISSRLVVPSHERPDWMK